MRTRSAGRLVAESLGGGTGVRVGRSGRGRRPREGNDERVDDLSGQGNDQEWESNGVVESRHGRGWPCCVYDGFMRLARLVPHLVTTESRMIERYVYGLDSQIHMMVAATEPKTIQKAVQISGALTDEAVRNGSIKKVEKRGNMREPSKG
ncbi:hypothetical protein Tco_1051280 [Tanacetum coccineum]